MLDCSVLPLPSFSTKGRHSVSGLSSGAFMTVQLHIAHSSDFIGAGVIAGGPYRAAESYRAAPTAPSSCILNSLYIAMTPLTASVAPDASALVEQARATGNIDPLDNLATQRLYIFTGTKDAVVNQYAVRSTRAFYESLGVSGDALCFVDDVPAGHSIITTNPEDSPLSANQPPYINKGDYMQSHKILDHIYPGAKPAADRPKGDLLRFEQADYVEGPQERACMAEFGYVYIPSAVAAGKAKPLGVHVVLHGCKQGYAYVDYINGREDIQNTPPYGDRYVRTTGYMEWAEANNLIILFPQADGGDSTVVQNPDGCWDWWGYSAQDPNTPDYYSQDAVQIKAIKAMLTRLTTG
ncbi:hypothetical protein [Tropicimonas sp. S265A]|uniref:extracellular catalytic domain type 2 short-chain-length polyhydroxyalkanoate depolymerase n=1 Tax=Tropicimonas sp. S265A TaxID=3415134 RepID=UPI003C7B81FC